MVKPGRPFQRGQFDRLTRLSRNAAVDQSSLEEPIDDLGLGIAVAFAAYKRIDANF